MMKKALTLVELVISGSIFLIIVLAVWAYHKSSTEFYQSSEYKGQLVNELNLAADHMAKTMAKVTGRASGTTAHDHHVRIDVLAKTIEFHVDDPAIVSPDDFSDDINMRYSYNAGAHSLDYCDDWDATLTPPDCVGTTETFAAGQLLGITLQPLLTNGIEYGIKINLRGRHRASKSEHMHNNPEAEIVTSVFFGEYSLS